MIALLVLTDGRRDCIERTLASAAHNLIGPVTTRVIFDDSGDDDYHIWLHRFDGYRIVRGGGRSGFAGAIQGGWNWLGAHTDEPFVLHLEDDFTFNRPVRLTDMAATLAKHPHLAQLALRRQAWSADELRAGGVVEVWPDEYVDCADRDGCRWLEHRLFFTTNPCLYRRELMAEGWPSGEQSERRFTHQLLTEGFDRVTGDDVRFGYWGSRGSGEAVNHIGEQRNGVGY